MTNSFFENRRMLGAMFDLDHDGSMSLGEAGAMGALGVMYASRLMRAAEEAERETDLKRQLQCSLDGYLERRAAKVLAIAGAFAL